LIKKAVIDGDIKAAAGFGIEETVEAVVFHRLEVSESDYMQSERSICQTAFVGIRWNQTNQYEQTAAS
jgi:hypothetical protein